MSDRFRYPDALVSSEWLATHSNDPHLRLYECTTYLAAPAEGAAAPYTVVSGRADFEQGHLPGAAFLDLQGELSDASSPPHLRFTMPDPHVLGGAFARRGIGDDTRVVLYARGAVQWATRVWWMLRAIGFDNAAILDGGWEKWQAESRAVSTEEADYPPATLTVTPRPALFAEKAEVAAAMEDGTVCTINALSPELHRGEDNRYGRAGRIPGSVNLPAASLTPGPDKTFLDPASVREAFERIGADPSKRTIVYCGGGIAATLDAYLLHQLGYEDVAVYDASMSEWAKDDSLPVQLG